MNKQQNTVMHHASLLESYVKVIIEPDEGTLLNQTIREAQGYYRQLLWTLIKLDEFEFESKETLKSLFMVSFEAFESELKTAMNAKFSMNGP